MTNPMKDIRIEKVVLNIGCGKDKNVEKAYKVLESITKRKPVITKSRKKSTFGVPRNKDIGVKVTVRQGTVELLKTLLQANEGKILNRNFDIHGNFGFGIPEHILIPGQEYDPKIGIYGLDVTVRLKRPGFSVKDKKIDHKVGKKHRISKDEAKQFVKDNLEAEIVDKIVKEY